MMVLGPEPLSLAHDTAAFDSGTPALDQWLREWARQAQKADSTRIYVIHEASRVVGFHALSAGSVRPEHAPSRLGKGQGKYDVPIVVLTRLGIDQSIQGKGYGAALLKDAFQRVLGAADIVGIRALHAKAKDDRAKQFYEHFGFEPSPVDPNGMYLLMKDLRAALGGSR